MKNIALVIVLLALGCATPAYAEQQTPDQIISATLHDSEKRKSLESLIVAVRMIYSRNEGHHTNNEYAIERIVRELVALESLLSQHTENMAKLQSENESLKRELRNLSSNVDVMRTQLNFGIR